MQESLKTKVEECQYIESDANRLKTRILHQ